MTRPGLTETDLRACIANGSEMSRERFVDLPHGAQIFQEFGHDVDMATNDSLDHTIFAGVDRAVRLELEYPDERALLSDFSLWHHVLNYWYLPSSEADGDRFESALADHGTPQSPGRSGEAVDRYAR
jgi:hypothetical protein